MTPRLSHRSGTALLRRRARRRGVALVIILAFVVLLTGVIVAFFSRAMAERQISNSSASQTKTSLFAEGVADLLIANLKQEIALTSTTPAGVSSVYLPLSGSSMLPQVSLGTSSNVTTWSPNLLIRSAWGAKFFSGTANIEEGAVAVSSTTPSLNGRWVSLSTWNKHCLLTGTDSSMTPATSGSNAFAAPDWVLVPRSGSTFATVPATPAGLTWSGSNSNTVVGRYAYAIYHEGGLLDANVAGYPQSPNTTGAQAGYKPGLAYADLAPIFSSAGIASGSAAILVDKLVAWRNSASAQNTGPSFSNPGFTLASGSNYFQFVLSNTTGFLNVSGSLWNSQGDRMFASRQEMIRFAQSGLGLSGTLLNALNYLTHFSRDLNQPSFVPATFAVSNPAPQVNLRGNGGNSAVTATGVNGTQVINPSFLAIRAGSAFTRNDGSAAVKDLEPLVKKRFALNRLAWLTYAGPITLDGVTYNPKLDASYLSALKNTYGFSDTFLLQGTPANVFKYFGLAWVTVTDPIDNTNKPMWVYDHRTTTPPTGASAAGKIKTLSNKPLASTETDSVVAAGREADFFELLKAAVNVGALGKAALDGNDTVNVKGWLRAQYNRDIQVDFAIIQMGANIIDQFDLDGYPTTIYFDDATPAQTYGSYISKQFHGVESMPYLYRLRANVIKASLPQPWAGNSSYTGAAFYNNAAGNELSPSTASHPGSAPLTQTGIGCIMQLPEVWNPHDWDSANSAQSVGMVGPTGVDELRIFAVGDSGGWYNGWDSSGAYSNWNYRSIGAVSSTKYDTGNANAWFGNQFVGQTITTTAPRTLSPKNTLMTFSMTNNAFREPTVLYMPGTAGGLKAPGITDTTSGVASELSAAGQKLLIGTSGFKSAVTDPAAVGAPAGQEYVGFFVWAVPLRWVTTVSGTIPICRSSQAIRSDTGFQEMVYLQFKDASGNWMTYDEKYLDNPIGMPENVMHDGGAFFFDTGDGFGNAQTWSSHIVDPRTSRFGMPVRNTTTIHYGWNGDLPDVGNPWVGLSGWLDGANGVTNTMRPDVSAGTPLYVGGVFYPPNAGWYPGNVVFNSTQAGRAALRPGLLTQNNPVFANDAKITANGSSAVNANFSGTPNATYQFYADADGVVRRAMGGYVSGSNSSLGLPLATANSYSSGAATRNGAQSSSRPMILNRPFRSVAELGYAFSGTPWKNLDFFTPESGYSGLLDVFCLGEAGDSTGMVAGKVNLNTRQSPVLQSIISGAYQDEWKAGASTDSLLAANGIDPAKIAAALVARTSNTTVNGQTPPTNAQTLTNLSDLVGRWNSAKAVTAPGSDSNNNTDGSQSYTGFVGDSALTASLGATGVISRYREAPVRALAASGQTRVWNLLIDLVAQTGRYPQSASDLSKFQVEGEQHYWVHVAIDRYTGQVIDKQVEEVK